MPLNNIDIRSILPGNEVYWKVKFCPKRRMTYNEYRISIELENRKRQYTCLCFEDLYKLIINTSIDKRCFYEHISEGDSVKFYLDYEYFKNDQNSIIDINNSLLSIIKLFLNVIKTLSDNINISLDDMIVLQSSSNEKHSYHIICNHENIRFINNKNLHMFVEDVIRIILLVTINHECLRKKNNINIKLNYESSLTDIINIFKIVWVDWFNCINCKIKNMDISVYDVCNLFVYNEKGYMVPCVDLKVYSIEQDFRMFMCTKKGEQRPLMKTTLIEEKKDSGNSIVFNIVKELNDNLIKDIMQKSLITERAKNNIYYVENKNMMKWTELIGFNMTKKRELFIEFEYDTKKKFINKKEMKALNRSEYEIFAEIWVISYLKSISSSGVIHSINTGKHMKFIMCNIRNMNICKELHDDYLNDSTIYLNFHQNMFSVRCNYKPCDKKPWIWQRMI